MYIENVTLKSVPADSLVLPVEEGTILTKNGTIPADLSQAYGIVPQKITNIPPTKKIYLAVAGTIDLKLNNVSFTEEEMQALGRDFNFVPGDEGGGNPNRVETITGTLADPWGDFDDAKELNTALHDGNASAYLALDISALQVGYNEIVEPLIGTSMASDYASFKSSGADLSSVGLDYATAVIIYFNFDDVVRPPQLYAQVGDTFADLSDYASLIPTTLTIIWHPLPEQS